ncbi:DUF1697 domain-containing protein [Aquimarina aquimarini]|uniref:DUF1697 domain-containing protein n=1 Tax=Aquimarina aquimarini TaxID=1191734 RepID=UPI001F20259E|nr:DUF1697 domain-containing protein [Aquimarina aquimarini]
MTTFIALLRGINVSGQKKIKMADLRVKLEKLGFISVRTYIQSGNIIFQYKINDIVALQDLIKKEIIDQFGYDVPVLVFTVEMLSSIYKKNPFIERLKSGEIEEKKMFFTILQDTPDIAVVKELMSNSYEEEYMIVDRTVYMFAVNGYGKTKLNNNFFERKLKTIATTRNLKTMNKLLELSSLG